VISFPEVFIFFFFFGCYIYCLILGGVICGDNSNLAITKCEFSSCFSSRIGGCIGVGGISELLIQECVFINCESSEKGGFFFFFF
jgi:hypothetical protein